MASFSSTGPYRYLNYIDSNNNNNQAPNTVDIIAKTSIGSRGAYAQTTHIDVVKLFPKKYDAFPVGSLFDRDYQNTPLA